jgi:hypothetical protein
MFKQFRHPRVGEACGEAFGQPDRPIGLSPSSNAPASKVTAPPLKAATTLRPSADANLNSVALHSVGTGELLCFSKSPCCRTTLADSEPRCSYPVSHMQVNAAAVKGQLETM